MVNAEQLPPQSPLQQEQLNDMAVSGPDQDEANSTVQSPPPVSRLHGFVSLLPSVVTAARRESTPQPLDRSLATSSSPSAATPNATTTQRRTAAFFKSVHRDILQPSPSPPPPSLSKSALKRPLELGDPQRGNPLPATSRLSGGESAAGASAQPPSPRAKRQHTYKSSSDSSDAEDVQTLQLDDDDEEEDEDGDATSGTTHGAKPSPLSPPSSSSAGKRKRTSEPLNFFMRKTQAPFAADLRSSGVVERAPREPISVSASRTRVCGQVFGRCELHFSDESLELVLWRPGESAKRIWQGTILYKHLERFSYYRGASPPYLLLLELRASEQGQTLFSEFYDSIFAKFAHEQRAVPSPNLFGAAFYFDEELDYVQCTSMSESFAALRDLFAIPIADDEALAYFDSEVNASSTDQAQEQTLSGLGARSLAASRPSDSASSASAFQQATALLRQTQSIAKFFQKALPLQTTATTSAANASAVVEIDDPSQPTTGDDAADTTSSADATVALAAAQKSKTLLTYPFDDGAETSGRISVTFGDIARLAPGEFLNDNIIDFYLRFLWRHQFHRDQLYFYSSHFFTQLNGGSGSASASLSHDDRFARVSRWTSKETDLFLKQFLFIPINDSFHWSIAVFCNPGSAVVRKRRRLRQVVVSKSGEVRARRPIALNASGEPAIVDLVDNFSAFRSASEQDEARSTGDADWVELREEFVDEVLASDEAHRREHPPCLLFLDSLKCHRKKKFTAMLRAYLEREWQSRHGASDHDNDSSSSSRDALALRLDHETIVSSFDASAITLLEPNIPMQTNSSDCGVFLLMYAAEVARRFPGGVTREDVESKFAETLTAAMFDLEHVQEFRDYLHQLLFCLHALQKRGLSEDLVAAEELERFPIEF